MTDQPLIFLSYASQDLGRVLPYYDRLKSAGLDVWIDKYRLKGGQKWDVEIRKALRRAFIIVIFVSALSVGKRGYVQRELKIALDYAEEKLRDDIYVVPVILDSATDLPDQLKDIQAIRGSFEEQCGQLFESIYGQLEAGGMSPDIAVPEKGVHFATREYHELWEGLPGYEVKFDLLELASSKLPQVTEINSIVNGWLMASLHKERRSKFNQDPQLFQFGQESFHRTHAWEARCASFIITGTTLSLSYQVYWYGAGAAHPNHHFQTFAFSLDPLIYIETLEEAFDHSDEGLAAIQAYVRGHFLDEARNTDVGLKEDWVVEGTDSWGKFTAFMFQASGIELLFAPYQVGPYAAGSHSVTVPYERVVAFMDINFQHLLGIAYLGRRSEIAEISSS